MATKTKKRRIYWKRGRAYADFRDYALWGGGQEALAGLGDRVATEDADEAMRLCAARLAELEEAKRRYPGGPPRDDAMDRIPPYVAYHVAKLAKKKRRGRTLTEHELSVQKHKLIHATLFLSSRGKDLLRDITPADIREWLADLEVNPPPALGKRKGGRRVKTLSDNTRAKYLFALNAMLRRACREERIESNPIDRLDPDEIPKPSNAVTPFLEVGEAALLLELARRRAEGNRRRTQHYVRMAVHLLSGGRGSEVLGLEKADLDFVMDRVWIRPNATRQNVNKSRGTPRTVPMWPQLKEILTEYLASPHAPLGPRLFDDGACMKWLARLARDLGWSKEQVLRRVFRVTYASARVQTLDGGAPVADWTVQQEMGHGSMRMLKEVYVRIGASRHRSDYVEYRWEQWEQAFGTQLEEALGGIPERWKKVLRALPREGATAKQWMLAAGVPIGTYYYIRGKLIARGMVLQSGTGRGRRFHPATRDVVRANRQTGEVNSTVWARAS